MLRVITAASTTPVSLDEARVHLRRDDFDDDEAIKAYLAAATAQAQNHVQRRFVTQVLEYVLTSWCRCIELPVAPVKVDGVVSIKYVDTAGALQTLDPALYVVRGSGPSVSITTKFGSAWPFVDRDASEPIVIRFTAGDAPENVEPNVKSAIKLILGHLYENRANVMVAAQGLQAIELPQGAEALLAAEIW